MVKKCILILCLLSLLLINFSFVYATEAVPAELYTSMQNVGKGTEQGVKTDSGLGGGVNIVIGMVQLAGSGIALIIMTMLGIKYMLASPADKADVKKEITPFIIGCILLFGASQVAGAIEELAGTLF